MAYRQFRNESTYEAPDYSFIGNTAEAISGVFRQIGQEKAARRKAADQFKFDVDGGSFENDTKILNEGVKNVVTRARQEILRSGRVSPETESLMKDIQSYKTISNNQMDRVKSLRQNINDLAMRDSYYNPDADLHKIRLATHGEDNDVDFRTRDERIAGIENSIGGVDSFHFKKYRADYVKEYGQRSKKVTTGNEFAKSTRYDQATFWDDKTGKPGVTADHAIDFLNSEKRVAQYYDRLVGEQLAQEIKGMKASGDKRVEWMKGLSDEDIANELINDPSKNIVNKIPYGERAQQLAMEDLTKADRVNTEVAYDRKDTDTNNSGGRWKNKNIVHTDAINSFASGAKRISGESSTVTTYGPGGRFSQKSGRPIQIETSNPIRTDIGRGITTRNNKGSIRMNLTGYQLMPMKDNSTPFLLESSSVGGMINEVSNLPFEYFDPNGEVRLQPELKIGMSGYVINEAGVLGDVNDKMFDISTRIAEAREKGDTEALGTLEDMEQDLNELKSMISGEYSEQELILAANRSGIRKTKTDMIIPADDSDLSNIRNLTIGFNLKDKSYWSPEMVELQEAYQKRYNEARAANFGAKKEEPAQKNDIPTVMTAEDYNNLPSGSEYIDPEGNKRRKK